MKNSKAILFSALTLLSIAIIPSCKKAEDSSDLTKNVVGHFTNSTTNTDIVVNKVDDNTVSLTLTTGSGSGEYTIGFPTAKMTSENVFTMDAVTASGHYCQGTETWSGTGSASNNNISVFLSIDGTGTGTIYDCQDWTDNVAASK